MGFNYKSKKEKLKGRISKLKSQSKSFQNAPKVGEAKIKKIKGSKKFKKLKKKGMNLKDNIDNYYDDQVSSIRGLSSRDLGF